MSKEKKDQSTPEKPIDFQAINPRYQGAMASDVVRAMVKPKVRDNPSIGIVSGRRPVRPQRQRGL